MQQYSNFFPIEIANERSEMTYEFNSRVTCFLKTIEVV